MAKEELNKIKKPENYEDLYYLNTEYGNIIVNGKFLEEFDKEIKNNIEKL